jgi:general secretion pathway protein A
VANDRAINQRITLRFHLRPLNANDVVQYLQHRLRAAGHQGPPIFTDAAAHAIHAATKGVPREVNRLAKLSLEYAWLTNATSIDQPAVDIVVADLDRHQSLPIL